MIGEEVSTMIGEEVSTMGGNYSDPMVVVVSNCSNGSRCCLFSAMAELWLTDYKGNIEGDI